MDGGNFVLFSTYRDCDDVLRHPLSSSDQLKSTAAQQDMAADPSMRQETTPSFLFLDPPDHTRLRKLVSKAFAPKVVNALQPEISALVDRLLDRIAAKGSFDVVADFAYPLPVAVICRLLGVPLEDEPRFSRASAVLAKALDPFFTDDQTASNALTYTALLANTDNDEVLTGGWYRNQFWFVPGPDGDALVCLGIHGQMVYVNPAAGVVAAKLSSWPWPQDAVALFATIAAFDAVAAAVAPA